MYVCVCMCLIKCLCLDVIPKKNSPFLLDEIRKIKINKAAHCFIPMPYESKISSFLATYAGGWMVGWHCPHNWFFRGCGGTVWKSRGDCLSRTLPGQKESQASVEFIFVQFRHCIRGSSQQATHRDRQTDSQTGQKGAPGRGNYHRKTKCSLLSIFFTSLLWRRWRNNLRLLSNGQVLPCGNSWHYVICEALEPWIKRQTQWQRVTDRRERRQSLFSLPQHSAPIPAETPLQLTARPTSKSQSESSAKEDQIF